MCNEDRDIDGRIILTWIFRKWDGDESSNQAAIAHIIKKVRLSTCSFRCLLQGGSPVQSGRGSSVARYAKCFDWDLHQGGSPVQFGSVASVRTGIELG